MKLTKVVKNFFFKTRIYNYYLLKNNISEISFTPKDAWPGDPVLGDQLVQGYYNLANKKVYSPESTLWEILNSNKYWLKEAHSFSWLRHLKARSGPLARKHARYLILDWLKLYKNWKYDSWELEVLSRRISSWVTNFDFLLAEKDEVFSYTLIESLFKQIKHLRNQASYRYFLSLEKDLGLEESSVKKIKVLKGLFLSSICFDDENDRYSKYRKILIKELKINFNEEGLHMTKSPSIQLSILGDLVTIREAIISKQILLPELLDMTIKKASHALRFFRKADGNFAVFNGSKQESKFLIDKILNQADGKARGRGPLNLPLSGFDKIVCQGTSIIVDTYNNNHKGSLSRAPHAVEINIGKVRLIGSCGTIHEKNQEWKESLLSASAHSTMIIEESDPFNMKEVKNELSYKRYKKNESEIIHLTHNGYKNNFSALCCRTIEVSKTGKDIAILDQILTDKILKFKIRIHLSPKIKVSLSLDKKKAIILFSEQGWSFRYNGDVKLSLEPSIFIEDNGRIRKTNQLILSGETIKDKTEVLWGITKNL